MPISKTNKQALTQQLLAAKSKAYAAEFELLLKQKEDDAADVKSAGKELSRKIDLLIGNTMESWSGDANAMINDVKKSNKKIQKSISEIKKNIRTSENAIKIIGYVDDVVNIVNKIV